LSISPKKEVFMADGNPTDRIVILSEFVKE
jgi:hypothetical protein